MKKIFIAFIVSTFCLLSASRLFAQGNAAAVQTTVAKMQTWQKSEWATFFNAFNSTAPGSDAPHVKAMYELDAYLHAAATDKALANKAVDITIKV